MVDTWGDAAGGPWAFSLVSSVGAFLPEIVLCATIVLILLVRVLPRGDRADVFWPTAAGVILSLFLAAVAAPHVEQRFETFTGLLVYDSFSVFMRTLLLASVALVVVLIKATGLLSRHDAPDIYALVLGAALGMCLMISANHLLIVYLGVEMASVASYALVALRKHRAVASEAALKCAVYGAATSGVMLYGISLIAGLVNSAHLPTIAHELAVRLPDMPGGERMVLTLSALLILVGLAFKLAAAPFHFWCPDVFEGTTAEVDAFLSVASKTAALGLLARVVIGMGMIAPPGLGATAAQVVQAEGIPTATAQAGAAVAAASAPVATATQTVRHTSSSFVSVRAEAVPERRWSASAVELSDLSPPDAAIARERARLVANLAPFQGLLGKIVALLAIITCTLGNLAAYGQTNIKRLLAYSTIAHAGYMMMAIPPVLTLAGVYPALAEKAVAGLGIYLAVYLFMNLGAFAVVAFVRNAMDSEQIADYAGLFRHCPGAVVCFALLLFSLLGMPPLAGFVGKFAVFASLVEGYLATGQGYLLVLFVVGAVNTALSLFYYVNVIKVMTFDADVAGRGPVRLPLVSLSGLFIVTLTLPIVVLFFAWEPLNQFALRAAQHLLG